MKKSVVFTGLIVGLLSVLPIIAVTAATPTPPNPSGPMMAPCAPGQMPTQSTPCMLPPCVGDQKPTPNNPCAVVGELPGTTSSNTSTPSASPTNNQNSSSPMNSGDNSDAPSMQSLQQTFASKYSADSTQTFFTTGGGTPGKLGIFFASNIRGVVLPSIEVRKSTSDGSTFQAHQCKSFDDPSCDPSKSWNGVKLVSGIGNCYNDPSATTSCIESFSIIGSDGKEHAATPETKFPASTKEFAGSPGLFPAGQAPWLWTVKGDPSGSDAEYLLAGYINSSAENKSVKGTAKMPGRGGVVDGKWLPLVQTFNFEVIPVYKETAPGIKAPLVQEVVDNNGLHRVVSVPVVGCYAADDNVCLNRRPFPDGIKVRLTMHLSRRISGWLVGRLDRPQISTAHINDNVDKINVVAGVSQDVFAGNWVNSTSSVLNSLKPPAACPNNNKFGAMISGQQGQMGMDPGEACAIDFYQQIGPQLGNKAFAITPSWTLTTAQKNSSTSQCITDVDGLAGVGATNASAYDPGAPEFNASKNSLTYRVAAPSQAPDGSQIAGRYALAMPTGVFQCLYNVKSIPQQATIGVTSLNGATVSQTILLNQANGWVNFAADNFDFSDTSLLTITLGKASSQSSTSTQSKTAKPITTTISCIKSKIVKVVTGINPKCPTGYRQK